jgi:hypothetical protein
VPVKRNEMKKMFLLAFLCLLLTEMVHSQDLVQMDSTLKAHSEELKNLKKLHITGYIQPQFQIAESKGIDYIGGGKFPDSVDNRFMIRRGRLRVYYHSSPFEVELITDNSEKGVSLHDLSVAYTFAKTGFKYTAGLFKRPFGFEQLYSSSLHETPERARFTTLLLPSEADLGFKLSYLNFKPFLIEAGIFNGNTTAADIDSYKDFIARISADKKLQSSNISGGLSFYHGALIQGSRYLYETEYIHGFRQFVLQDTLLNKKGEKVKRQYIGADIQYSFENVLGKTTLRSEWMSGTQPGSDKTTESPKSATAPTFDTYLRKFNALSCTFLHNFAKTNLQLVVKYDWYDPNTEAKTTDIGIPNTRLSATDLKIATLGLGLNYYLKNMYIMFYYEFIKNEKAINLTGFDKDIKDNVLTIRTQFKF